MVKYIHITFDTDWAAEEVVQYAVNLIVSNHLSATFFATGFYKCLQNTPSCIEVALHPNFNPILNGSGSSFTTIFDELHTIYPNAKGFRSHSLTQSSHILSHAKHKGMVYDSNLYHPKQGEPYLDYSGLIRFTHTWVDLGHLLDKFDFDITKIPLSETATNILDFHPIHTYLNTPSTDYYNSIKALTTQAEELKANINKDNRGVQDIVLDLIEYIKTHSIKTQTLFELYNTYEK